MIVRIQTRDDNGKYCDAHAGQFAETALKHIVSRGIGNGDGWWFLRFWLCQVCLMLAANAGEKAEQTDRWISRYRALRGIE